MKETNELYLQVIEIQLKEKHIQTVKDAMIDEKDREKWSNGSTQA